MLRKVHSLNQLCCKRKQFPVKGIQLSLGGNRGLFDVRGSGCRRRLNVFYGQWQQVRLCARCSGLGLVVSVMFHHGTMKENSSHGGDSRWTRIWTELGLGL